MLRSINIKSLSVAVSTLVLSTSVNAVVLNTLNGVDYEWLELTETAGLSRDAIEVRLTDVNDDLYGYEYASRQLIEDLLLSYTPWDGTSGTYSSTPIIEAVNLLSSDFGVTAFRPSTSSSTQITTVEGVDVVYDGFIRSRGIYGLTGECGDDSSCVTHNLVYRATDGTPVGALVHELFGWSSTGAFRNADNASRDNSIGSYLYKSSVVPIPAAVWLFGSGLLGLIGVARRKKV